VLLVVVAGPPCSGKSTLAAGLARRRGVPHLEMDATRMRILPGAAHTRADRAVAYRAMHLAAELLLGHDIGAVLDASYGHAEDRREVAAVARRTGADLALVECRVAVQTAIQRFLARGPDLVRRDLTQDRVEEMVRKFPYTGAGLLLDSGQPPEACLAAAERYLAQGNFQAAAAYEEL
jgi:predicted kinase